MAIFFKRMSGIANSHCKFVKCFIILIIRGIENTRDIKNLKNIIKSGRAKADYSAGASIY